MNTRNKVRLIVVVVAVLVAAVTAYTLREPCRYDPAKVHPVGVPGVNGTAAAPFVFYRLFGDGTGEEQPQVGSAHSAIVAIDDNFSFRSSFNSAATYKVYFDFDGDGVIGVADNFQFRSRFNRLLTWTA